METGTDKCCASDTAKAASSGPVRLALALAFTLVIGVLLSASLFFVIREWERKARRDELNNLAQERVEILQNKMLGSLEVLHSVARFYSATDNVSRAAFERFAADARQRHPELQGLSWDPLVADSSRVEFEAAARLDGYPNFQFKEMDSTGRLVPAVRREEYVPVYYEQPFRKNEAALGFDLASSPDRKKALTTARDSGEPAATKPIRLVQETENQMGFLVLLPIYRGSHETTEQRRKNLAGFASAIFRISDLVKSSWDAGAGTDVNVLITDSADGNARIYQSSGSPATKSAGLGASETLRMAGVDWKASFRPTAAYLAGHSLRQCWAALAAGLVITALLVAYLHRELRRTAEIEHRVAERTSELSNEVAERLRVEDALRKAEKKYRSIFEHSIEGIFQTTPDGHYLSANPALARIYGYPSPEELMADLDDIGGKLYVEPERRSEFMRIVQAQGSVSSFESQVRRKDGATIWISENARAVGDEHGEILYYEGAVEDITSRKIANETLRRAHHDLEMRVVERTSELAASNEALHAEILERKRAEAAAEAASRAKSTFLAHMSHEIRTPLNAILGYAQILQRNQQFTPDQRRAVETIASSGNHLFGLIDDVLDISKIEAGRMELEPINFDLGSLILRLESMFQHRCQQKRICMTVENFATKPCWRNGDEGKLRQVLINLLGNAVKFTEAGWVRLKVGGEGGAGVRFEISDTGIGIPQEEQAFVLQAFLQGVGGTRKGGTGLGLAISQSFIELMGGELGFISQPGTGSCFHFTVPLPEAECSAALAPVSGSNDLRLAPGYSVRAMVVDDIQENREVLAGVLKVIGCDVITADHGEHAIMLARNNPVDIIFMDIWMPGLNGIEATQRILAEHGEKIKMVAHSASAFDHEQRRYLDAGFDDFFAKPFRCDRLCTCLKNLLGVQFAKEEVQASPVAAPGSMDPLPEPFASRLRKAAELYSITEIKNCLRELTQLEPCGNRFAEHLRPFVDRFDMNAILQFLDQPKPAPASELI